MDFIKQLYFLMVVSIQKIHTYFNFMILLKSRKFDAREIYTFYSIKDEKTLVCQKKQTIKNMHKNVSIKPEDIQL